MIQIFDPSCLHPDGEGICLYEAFKEFLKWLSVWFSVTHAFRIVSVFCQRIELLRFTAPALPGCLLLLRA